MDLLNSLKIAAAGLRAQSSRMRVISENLANAESSARDANGDPYRRRITTFVSELDRELGVNLIRPGKTIYDRSNFGQRFEPGNPAADDKGYIKTPNVNPLIETMDMRQAQRSYEANLNVISATRRMLVRTIDILRA
ncbi:MAG: flagellar basal body rod protein FlgC [Fimbriimonadaceae bacterium]|nr:flagellar basal body rod protein FlgC [Alphaproteobacteria bacterium]